MHANSSATPSLPQTMARKTSAERVAEVESKINAAETPEKGELIRARYVISRYKAVLGGDLPADYRNCSAESDWTARLELISFRRGSFSGLWPPRSFPQLDLRRRRTVTICIKATRRQ